MLEGANFWVKRARITAWLLTSMSEVQIETPAKHNRNSSAEQYIRVCATRKKPKMLLNLPDVTSSAKAGLKRQRKTTTACSNNCPVSLVYSDNDVPPATLAYS